ncbi:MAG: Lrp/AsnC family transcriptional regulator [Desulfobacterales bacterium]|nr:Lrp/AsnC family transcriptional regulator [Desulfobacterales bacterium]
MTLREGNLDQLETRIVCALQTDARKSFKSIAAELNVSESTISNRVNRLVQNGVLKLEARINPFKLSHKVTALVGMNVRHPGHGDTLKKIEALPHVNAVWVTTGKYDLFAEVMADSISDLNEFIFGHGLSSMEDITFTETHIMLHSDTKYFKLS